MFKSCVENKCTSEAACSCCCKSSIIYVCDEHIIKHIRTPGKHTIESLIIELDYNQQSDIFPKFKEMLKYIQEIKRNVFLSAKQLIECIEKEKKQALK